MEIGRLRHRITLQKLRIATNSNGFEVENWEEFKTVWAAVSNLQGREYFAAAAIQAENMVKFTIRYLSGVDTSIQILFRDKVYNISSIDNIQYKNRYMEIKAQEVSANGENRD
ncbi:phage head closure protein [Alkalihalobacterium bogoriense]|uniref:phage head closure protein n=1 Tax=Alkalihalobacterium bogoriense TaxID=246272 RepID=UPI00047B8827|nr:phage head closure protein [Alkalihalobacterium bogoriense]